MDAPVELRDAINATHSRLFPHQGFETARCLEWAACACFELCSRGHRAVVNAGTANFRANNEDFPTPTHIGYFWQELSEQVVAERYLARGILPEMHCWVGLPEEGRIIDPSTKWIKQRAIDSGIPLTCPDPPDCFYGSEDSWIDGWVYKPYEYACLLADRLAMEIMEKALNVDIY